MTDRCIAVLPDTSDGTPSTVPRRCGSPKVNSHHREDGQYRSQGCAANSTHANHEGMEVLICHEYVSPNPPKPEPTYTTLFGEVRP